MHFFNMEQSETVTDTLILHLKIIQKTDPAFRSLHEGNILFEIELVSHCRKR